MPEKRGVRTDKEWLEDSSLSADLVEAKKDVKKEGEKSVWSDPDARYVIVISFMLMFIAGIQYVGMEVCLTQLARNCGTSATAVWYVFILKAVGKLVACFIIGPAHRAMGFDAVVAVASAFSFFCFVVGAEVTDEAVLAIWFFFLATTSAIMDTEAQIMCRQVLREKAGPFLSINEFSLSLGGLFLAGLYAGLKDNVEITFYICTILPIIVLACLVYDRSCNGGGNGMRNKKRKHASISVDELSGTSGDGDVDAALALQELRSKDRTALLRGKVASDAPSSPASSPAVAVVVAAAPSSSAGMQNEDKKWREEREQQNSSSFTDNESGGGGGSGGAGSGGSGAEARSIWRRVITGGMKTEVTLAMCLFWIMGCFTFASYIQQFISEETTMDGDDDDDDDRHAHMGSYLVLAFWIGMVVSRLRGVYTQANISTEQLFTSIQACTFICFCSALLVFVPCGTHATLWVLWVFAIMFGLSLGPVLGYYFDLSNRLTHGAEESTALVILGLNLGACCIPAFCGLIWDSGWLGLGPTMLPITLIISIVVSEMHLLSLPRGTPPSSPSLPSPKKKEADRDDKLSSALVGEEEASLEHREESALEIRQQQQQQQADTAQ